VTARLRGERATPVPIRLRGVVKRTRASPMVLGAEDDNGFTQDEVHATARAYGTEAKIFPGMGHDIMLEPGWQTVAEYIDTWLIDRGL
jgi:alpha-beta hydrolase superfamily lysophospholipase